MNMTARSKKKGAPNRRLNPQLRRRLRAALVAATRTKKDTGTPEGSSMGEAPGHRLTLA
jgi:hypothetical protein